MFHYLKEKVFKRTRTESKKPIKAIQEHKNQIQNENSDPYTPLIEGNINDTVYEQIKMPNETVYREQSLKSGVKKTDFEVLVYRQDKPIPKTNVFIREETEKEKEIKQTRQNVRSQLIEFNTQIQDLYDLIQEEMNTLYSNVFQDFKYDKPEFYMNTSQTLTDGRYNKYKFKNNEFERSFGHINDVYKLKQYLLDKKFSMINYNVQFHLDKEENKTNLSNIVYNILTLLNLILRIKQNPNYETNEDIVEYKKKQESIQEKQTRNQQEVYFLKKALSVPSDGFRLPTSSNRACFLW